MDPENTVVETGNDQAKKPEDNKEPQKIQMTETQFKERLERAKRKAAEEAVSIEMNRLSAEYDVLPTDLPDILKEHKLLKAEAAKQVEERAKAEEQAKVEQGKHLEVIENLKTNLHGSKKELEQARLEFESELQRKEQEFTEYKIRGVLTERFRELGGVDGGEDLAVGLLMSETILKLELGPDGSVNVADSEGKKVMTSDGEDKTVDHLINDLLDRKPFLAKASQAPGSNLRPGSVINMSDVEVANKMSSSQGRLEFAAARFKK